MGRRLDRVIKSLAAQKRTIYAKLQRGLQAAGEVLLEASHEIAPIDTRLMVETSYVRPELPTNDLPGGVIVAYTTEYAPVVHEDPRAAHGEAFNIKYAAEIARGETHARRPQERYHFLGGPEGPTNDPGVQARMRAAMRREVQS